MRRRYQPTRRGTLEYYFARQFIAEKARKLGFVLEEPAYGGFCLRGPDGKVINGTLVELGQELQRIATERNLGHG